MRTLDIDWDEPVGLLSERLAMPQSTEYEDRDGYTLVSTPGFPDFYDGNLLELWSEPDLTQLQMWRDEFDRAFAGVDGVTHSRLTWEMDPRGPGYLPALRDAAKAVGYQVWEVNVRLRPAQLPAPVLLDHEADFVLCTTDDDWRDAIACLSAFGDGIPQAFWVKRYAEFRRSAEAGFGNTMLVRVGGQPAAIGGLYSNSELGTLQDVATLEPFRRQGLSSALVARLVAMQARARPGAATTVMVDPGSAAEALYVRAGFTDLHSVVVQLVHPDASE